MIKRLLITKLLRRLPEGKALIISGARQVGKTTLAQDLEVETGLAAVWFVGDEPDVRRRLHNITSSALKSLIGQNKLVIIDEAQRIPGIGLTIKLLIDQIKDVQVVVTGSSALDLAGEVEEPLTGRKFTYKLYPLSFGEMVSHHGLWEEERQLHHRLIYGYYPEIVTHPGDEKERLSELASSYLYKDILALGTVKKPMVLEKILQALAYQIGSEVSYNELARTVGADKSTVEKYIDLLEKSFVLYRLPAFSRNLRNEIQKGKKIYFIDNGIRNAVIRNLNPIEARDDVGPLWENWIISERLKAVHYQGKSPASYFWRTTQQQEVDYLEEENGELRAWQFKWNPKSRGQFSKSLTRNYNLADTRTISPDNFQSFIHKL